MRERLSKPDILIAPGAYDGLMAKLIEYSGFEAVYLSGAGVSYSTYGTPDLGLITQTQMTARIEHMAQATHLPIIVDGDTGYGNAINVRQTVMAFERAGAAAIQLEDQQFPKRCGHLAGKELISAAEMVGKIRAACDARRSSDFLIIGRTDARSVLGLDAAIERGRAYVEAGADVLFIESPYSVEELEAIAAAFPDVPLMANMVEGGKTPLLSASELEAMGYALVIFPNSLTRRFAHAGLSLLAALKSDGTTASQLNEMMPFTELNALLGIDDYRELERLYLPQGD